MRGISSIHNVQHLVVIVLAGLGSFTVEHFLEVVSEVLIHERIDYWIGHIIGEVHIEDDEELFEGVVKKWQPM